MDDIQKRRIASKLRFFGEAKFGKIKIFAEAIGMHPSALQSSYLNGRSLPGAELLAKLLKMGCDLNWLLDDDIDVQEKLSENPVTVELRKINEENLRLKEQLGKIASIAELADIIRQGQKK